MYNNKPIYRPSYNNQGTYYNEIDAVKHACVISREFSIQIKNRGITSTYQHIPSKWLTFTPNSMKCQLRQFPTLNSFMINTVGMKVEETEFNRFTLTNPDFDIEIKIVFY